MTEFWRQRNVFVTGASGMLGSALTARLVERGANVTILLRDTVHSSELVRSGTINKVNIVRGDLRDFDVIARTLHEYEIETVFHLGAQTIVGTANRHPIGTFESNIKGTWNVLEACRGAPLVKRIVVASSDKAYGDQEILPYKENAPLQGQHPYDVSKSCADLITLAYHKSFGLPVAITRCGNIYGAGDLNFNRIVPGTIRSILNHEQPVIRSDGKFVRDYFYVEDAVNAYMVLAGNLDRKEVQGQAFNFSTEQPLDVIDMVKLISRIMGSKLQPVIKNQASNEIRDQYLASGKAREVLGWKPSYTLEQGLKLTIPWYKKQLAGTGRKR